MLKKKQNKKGFTLAELLIVVAIIAVLTAIAVPLFVGALNDAEDNVAAANKRAVRVAAVDRILLNDSLMYDTDTKTQYAGWTVKALISADGNITQMEIQPHKTAPEEAVTEVCKKLEEADLTNDDYKVKKDSTKVAGEKGGYFVTIYVTDISNNIEVNKAA